MTTVVFDRGEVRHLSGLEYFSRAGYFVFISLFVIPGTIFAIRELINSPWDALYVLPAAFLATSIGANTSYHMYFTHRAFKTNLAFSIFLGFMGSILCQDSLGQWVANHKRHHRHVDISGKDPHSPQEFGSSRMVVYTLGLFWASAGWKFSKRISSKDFYARQTIRDPIAGWFDRNFVLLSFSGFLFPAFVGYLFGGLELAVKWLCYFGSLRVFIGYFFTEFVTNGLCHVVGSRKFDIRGNSTNLELLAPATFGATLHHNHHAFPRVLSPAIDGEIDTMKPLYWVLVKLGIIELASSPTRPEIDAKKPLGT